MPPPVVPNVAQMLGQLSTSPPAGPIPTTPYAPVSVAPLQLQQPIAGVTPPAPIYPKPFTFGGGGLGALMGTPGPGGGPLGTGPGGLGVTNAGGRGEEHGASLLPHNQVNPYYQQNMQRALANRGITPNVAPAAAPAVHPAVSSLLQLMQNPAQGNLGQTMLQLGAPQTVQQKMLQQVIAAGGPRGDRGTAALMRPEVYHGGAG